MTEKDLDEFEKEFGFKLLPTSFKKPLSEITKEEYRERIEYLYNAIINDDSNIDETIKDRIDELIKTYQMYIEWNKRNIEKDKENLIFKLNNGIYENIQLDAKDINVMKDDIDLYVVEVTAMCIAELKKQRMS